MADRTKIEWTDATWNPITGCSVVSPGCTNCYAMKLAGTRLRNHPSRAGLTRCSKAGPVWTGEVRFNEKALLEPLRWRRPRRIFVCAHGDLFAENAPDEWIDQVFAVMALAPQHIFQVLTKRPERMREYMHRDRRPFVSEKDIVKLTVSVGGQHHYFARTPAPPWPLPNVWLGVSVEDQQRADERIPLLLDTPASIRWISAEPTLGPVDVTPYLFIYTHADDAQLDCPEHGDKPLPFHPATTRPEDIATSRLDWVVAGGESGRNARPMHPDWARSLRDQCAAAGVPFFFKQWGEWRPRRSGTVQEADGNGRPYTAWPDGTIAHGRADDHGGSGILLEHVGKKKTGRVLDGCTHDAMPEVR